MAKKPLFNPDLIEVKEIDPRGGPIKAWSYSSLKEFEQCSLRTKFGKIDKIPTPSHPAAERGTQIHDSAECWIRGELDALPDALSRFEDGFDYLRAGFDAGTVMVEDPWAFTLEWDLVEWNHPDCWVRMKLDAYVSEDPSSAVVIDFKTGRKDGNELAHSTQAQIYAIGAFMRDPDLDFVKTEFWYLDKGGKLEKEYTRERAMMFVPKWIERGVAMTSCTDFHPTPSKFNCKWCSYIDQCEWGVKG